MLFLFQKEDKIYNLESSICKDIVKNRTSFINTYEDVSIKELSLKNEYKYAIPIGTIPFLNSWLSIYVKKNKTLTALEIPSFLRKDEFLRRKYNIIKGIDNLPKDGNFFIKNISSLKSGSFCGHVQNIDLDKFIKNNKNDSLTFVVSNVLNIISEWRIYVISGKIVNISNYEGNPLCFPDLSLINKIYHESLINYSLKRSLPYSFSFDVCIFNNNGINETALLEVHTWNALGLYNTVWGNDLLQAYIDSIKFECECE